MPPDVWLLASVLARDVRRALQVEYGQQVSSGTVSVSAAAAVTAQNTRLARKLAKAVDKAATRQQTDALLAIGLNL
jgi:hypothetical protein